MDPKTEIQKLRDALSMVQTQRNQALDGIANLSAELGESNRALVSARSEITALKAQIEALNKAEESENEPELNLGK